VIVLVGGQPLKLLATNIPDNLKLLKFDPNHPTSAKLLQEYRKADIQKASYPLLNIAEPSQPSLSVDSYLITANCIDQDRQRFVAGMADRFCDKFDELQAKGHPKWKALTWKPGSPLPALSAGWQYSTSVKDRLSRCESQAAAPPPPSACKPQDRFVGLCH